MMSKGWRWPSTKGGRISLLYLCQYLNLIKNNLSIITYNYDRSLEQYLFIALRAAFNLKSSECRTLMKSIPIIHMHGDLGALPWQLKGGIEYSPQITEKKIASALSNIQLISESTSQALIDMVKKKLLSSRKVFFMGLAYHPDYMDNLEIGKIQQTALRGTLINMLSAEEASVREKYHRMIDFQKLNCYHFLTKNLW